VYVEFPPESIADQLIQTLRGKSDRWMHKSGDAQVSVKIG
jgi:hypothetical protein